MFFSDARPSPSNFLTNTGSDQRFSIPDSCNACNGWFPLPDVNPIESSGLWPSQMIRTIRQSIFAENFFDNKIEGSRTAVMTRQVADTACGRVEGFL